MRSLLKVLSLFLCDFFFLFSGCFPDFSSVSFSCLTMKCVNVFEGIYSTWGSLGFMDLWLFFFFIHFEKFSGHYLFIFLLYLIFFLFFWDSNFRYVRPFWYSPKTLWCSVLLWVIRHRPPPIPFYFWVSVWTISIDLPANSVIFLSCTWSAEEPTGGILHLWHCILSF